MKAARVALAWITEVSMSDHIQTIRGIINEHESIEEQVRQALRGIEDWQISLELTIASGKAAQIESLSVKQRRLVQALESLEDGMLGHNQREEHELLEFVGPAMIRGLSIQHREITEQLRSVRLLLNNTELKALNMTELAAKYPNIKKELENTYRLIVEHGKAEDIVLHLILKGVLANGEDAA
jgi:hypothetical protein